MPRPKTPSKFTTYKQLLKIRENDYILDNIEYNQFEVDEQILFKEMRMGEDVEIIPDRPKSEILKRCAKCNDEKCVSEFHKNAQNADGLHSYCKDCRNPVELKRHYNITG